MAVINAGRRATLQIVVPFAHSIVERIGDLIELVRIAGLNIVVVHAHFVHAERIEGEHHVVPRGDIHPLSGERNIAVIRLIVNPCIVVLVDNSQDIEQEIRVVDHEPVGPVLVLDDIRPRHLFEFLIGVIAVKEHDQSILGEELKVAWEIQGCFPGDGRSDELCIGEFRQPSPRSHSLSDDSRDIDELQEERRVDAEVRVHRLNGLVELLSVHTISLGKRGYSGRSGRARTHINVAVDRACIGEA